MNINYRAGCRQVLSVGLLEEKPGPAVLGVGKKNLSDYGKQRSLDRQRARGRPKPRALCLKAADLAPHPPGMAMAATIDDKTIRLKAGQELISLDLRQAEQGSGKCIGGQAVGCLYRGGNRTKG